MSVLLIPEAVQILEFEITDEEVSLLHVECVLSRIPIQKLQPCYKGATRL